MATKKMICCRCWGNKNEPGKLSSEPCVRCKGVGVEDDVVLSASFWLSEFVYSETAVRQGIPNEPTSDHVAHLKEMCKNLLQPIRDAVGPISISSGFRGHILNAAVGGSDGGVHPDGNAADCSPVKKGMTRKKLVDFIVASSLPFDQVIFEGTWVHIGYKASNGRTQRKQALMAFPTFDPVQKSTKMKFFPYDPKDPRIGVS